MAIPQNTKIPTSNGSFMKLQEGPNRVRFLSDITIGWEGWKSNSPFRHKGEVCKIKAEDVDLNQNKKPNINYIWIAIVWNYTEKRLQILELSQKTIMGALFDLEQSEDWGDLKGYDIEIKKKKEEGKTSYTVLGIPPKPVSIEIRAEYEKTELHKNVEDIFNFNGTVPVEDIKSTQYEGDLNYGEAINPADIPF